MLKNILSDCGFDISYPCGGNGRCGKCAVRAEGSLSPLRESEKSLPEGFRLACKTFATGDVDIFVPSTDKIEGIRELYLPPFDRDSRKGFGTVTDIGTTTVAVYLFDLESGSCISSICLPNPQITYGADVISRIDYARRHRDGKLSSTLTDALSDMVSSFGKEISESVVTGNTSMLHFYCGYDTDGMASAPFCPCTLFGQKNKNVYIPRCISPFIGADVTCGILSSSLISHRTALFIDMGTNCETVLWHEGKGYCCSSAAGPAFEGVGISCGSPSVPGAVNSVNMKNGEIIYTVIGGQKPVGICGSGLIDAAACMLEAEVMDSTGYIENSFYIGDSGLCLTQNDIRQFQLAKAAVRAGIDSLLFNAGATFDEVEAVYLAGGFGSRINVESCEKTGLLPTGAARKSQALGNTAASGAAMLLLNNTMRTEANEIASNTVTLSLADSTEFSEAFIKYISF